LVQEVEFGLVRVPEAQAFAAAAGVPRHVQVADQLRVRVRGLGRFALFVVRRREQVGGAAHDRGGLFLDGGDRGGLTIGHGFLDHKL